MTLAIASGFLCRRYSSNHSMTANKLLLCCGVSHRRWNRPVTQIRDFSQGSSEAHSKLYELRTYSIYPQYLKPFLAISAEWMHLRCNHSKMIGYWMTELGGINQAVHIWEYDSFAHRAQVRKSVGADKDWQEKIFTKIVPMISLQENCVLELLPWSPLKTDVAPGGVYELQSFSYHGCGVTEWDRPLEDYTKSRACVTSLVGAFRGYMAGDINTSVQLWHYSSPDDVDSAQSKTRQDKDITSKYSSLLKNVSRENRKIMNAQSWSVLK